MTLRWEGRRVTFQFSLSSSQSHPREGEVGGLIPIYVVGWNEPLHLHVHVAVGAPRNDYRVKLSDGSAWEADTGQVPDGVVARFGRLQLRVGYNLGVPTCKHHHTPALEGFLGTYACRRGGCRRPWSDPILAPHDWSCPFDAEERDDARTFGISRHRQWGPCWFATSQRGEQALDASIWPFF